MTAVSTTVSGTAPGQRRLNGPQTTGRDYRNLSAPDFTHATDIDVAVPMRDGIHLMADIHRPNEDGRYPALIAASPYPRQMQDVGAPMGFIEAGASDFFVPRGYVHVIANLRGTGGSGGTYTLYDETERQDLYDLVEWAAAQPWCDGNVGMIGISYFAMSQLEAASQHPPHLKAIFPVAVTGDLFEGTYHHGLFSSSFATPFILMVGITADHGDELWRGPIVDAARHVLANRHLHQRFGHMNGEASVTMLNKAERLHHETHPWDDLWRSIAVEHQTRDAFWDDRNVLPLLADVDIPVYLGCDFQNVPLHLPGTFTALEALTSSPNVRVGLLGDYGLTWPWESLHVEALAWFDHWLKDRETGILDGPPIRYWMAGAEEWRTMPAWPPADAVHQTWYLHADATLASDTPAPGTRQAMTLGTGLNRAEPSPSDPPRSLTWTSAPLTVDLDLVGEIELVLDATITAMDTAWIVTLQDVAPDGTVEDITAGWLRASLRQLDEAASRPGRPVVPCAAPVAVPIGEQVQYRIPLVPNARRFAAGHRIQLHVSNDDQPDGEPQIMSFRHAPVGTNCLHTIASSSYLLLPVIQAT